MSVPGVRHLDARAGLGGVPVRRVVVEQRLGRLAHGCSSAASFTCSVNESDFSRENGASYPPTRGRHSVAVEPDDRARVGVHRQDQALARVLAGVVVATARCPSS